jgi:hypothetical protein
MFLLTLPLATPLFSGCDRDGDKNKPVVSKSAQQQATAMTQPGGDSSKPAITNSSTTPPSDATLKELMELTEMRKLVDAMPTQIVSSMDVYIQQALQGKAATPRQQQAVDTMKKKLADLFASELSYDKMMSMWLPVYRETFSDEEVVGMIAFYKTPAGQAVIHKMPALMKNVMQTQQQLMLPLMPKIQEIAKDFGKEMQAASEANEPSGGKGTSEGK